MWSVGIFFFATTVCAKRGDTEGIFRTTYWYRLKSTSLQVNMKCEFYHLFFQPLLTSQIFYFFTIWKGYLCQNNPSPGHKTSPEGRCCLQKDPMLTYPCWIYPKLASEPHASKVMKCCSNALKSKLSFVLLSVTTHKYCWQITEGRLVDLFTVT